MIMNMMSSKHCSRKEKSTRKKEKRMEKKMEKKMENGKSCPTEVKHHLHNKLQYYVP